MMVDTREARVEPIWHDRLKNDAYKNWLKVGYGMHIVNTGIRPYIERESKAFHGCLLTKAMAPCACVQIPGRRPNPYHDMAVCDWAKDLKHHHIKRNPTWSQSDGSKWTDPIVGHWEVAKLYMPFGCARGKVSAEETDATGLLNLLQFCDHFKIDRTNVEALKTTRNNWAHAPQQELTDDQTTDAFTSMKNLLNDAEFLADADAVESLGKITGLEMQTLIEFEENIDDIEEVVKRDFKEFMETILEKLDSLEDQQDTHTNKIIDEIRQFKGILEFWKYCCTCLNTTLTFVKGMSKKVVIILLLSIGICWLSNDTQDIGCLPNNFDHLELKQFDFTEYLSSARQDFVGRKWLFQNLTDTLRNSNNTQNGFLFIAAPGFGKSAFLSNLICTKSSRYSINTQILGYHFCIHSDSTTKKGGKFVQNLANMMAFRITAYKDLLNKNSFLQRVLKVECPSDPSGCFEQAILSPLLRLSNNYNFRQMYIVVDAMDECIDINESEKDASIVNIIGRKSRRFPKWLRVIATARNVSSIKRQLKTFKQIELFQDDQRNLRDIEDFLTLKFPFNETVISQLVNKSQGNFLYIKLVSEQLRGNWFDADKWDSLPATIESAYLDFFNRKFGSVEKFRAPRNICEILVSALHPLTINEIYGILHYENKGFHYEYDFMPILDDFSDYLRYTVENKYLSFFHNSLQEWLTSDTNRGGKYFVDQVNGNRLLARYFLNKFQEKSVPVSAQFVYQLATYIVRGGNSTHLVHSFLSMDSKLLTTADTTTNTTALHLAAGHRDGRILNLLLNIFKNLDIEDGKGLTPLFYATRLGFTNNVRVLHRFGASLHVMTRVSVPNEGQFSNQVKINDCELQMCGYNLLHVAAQKGHHKIVKYLLENNIDISVASGTNDRAIYIAAKFGHSEIMKTLVENGEKLDHECLYFAVSRQQSSAVEFLLQNGIKDECRSCEISAKQNVPHQRSCNTALHIAAINGFHEIADLLLNTSKVNALTCANLFGREPLHEAIRNNNFQVAKVLLQSGANPSSLCSQRINKDHLTREEVNEMCPCGFSSLHIAAYYGFPAITELLLQYKAAYNAGDCDDMQPIHIAACRGHGDVLSTFVKNGVSINSKNSKGMTATHYACKCKAGHIFGTLATLGADGYTLTVDNRSPLDFSPHFNLTLFLFTDSYVKNPIDPIDFNSMYSVDKQFESARNTMWTKFLTTFPVSGKEGLDVLMDISVKVTDEQYGEILTSHVPHTILASHWLPYTLASLTTSVNHNLDVSLACGHLNAVNKRTFISHDLNRLWRDDASLCARLIDKIQINMVYTADVLLSFVINVHCKTSDGLSPILAYLRTGGGHMAKVLVKHGVTISYIKCGGKFEDSVFHLAAYHKLHYLQYLTIFQDSIEWEKYLKTENALFDYLFDEYRNVTTEGKSRIERVGDGPLTKVIKVIKSHPKCFRIIDECVDGEGYTALHRAAQGGNVVAVKHFLDWGADPKAKPHNAELDPLVLAIGYAIKYRPHYNFHKPNILTYLEIDFASLTANAIMEYLTKDKPFDIGCDNQKEKPTLLHLAATRGMWRFVKMLFVARDQSKVVGLNANCPTKHGITPMYLAKVYGGGDCQWANPWCKIIDVLLDYGGSQEIVPQIATEHFVIVNYIFNQLPGQFNLEFNAKQILQDNISLSSCFEMNSGLDLWDDDYSTMQSELYLPREFENSILSLRTARIKNKNLFLNYSMFLGFITAKIRSAFTMFNESDGTKLGCERIVYISPLTGPYIYVRHDEEITPEEPDHNFDFSKEETIIYPPPIDILNLCSEEVTQKINTIVPLLHHNHHSFLASYKKYKIKMEKIKTEYGDYFKKEKSKQGLFNSNFRLYEIRAACRFRKTTYRYARLKFLLHTARFWNEQLLKKYRALPSISIQVYVLQKIKELILSDDTQKMADLILQLAENGSVEDHEYLKMLRFIKAPMFDKTMSNE